MFNFEFSLNKFLWFIIVYNHLCNWQRYQRYQLLNIDIELLAECFKVNKLSLNIGKTYHALFWKTKNFYSYILKLDGNTINRVKCIKFLDLLIDENLDWHEHIHSCKAKISRGLYALNKIKHIINTNNIRIIFTR